MYERRGRQDLHFGGGVRRRRVEGEAGAMAALAMLFAGVGVVLFGVAIVYVVGGGLDVALGAGLFFCVVGFVVAGDRDHEPDRDAPRGKNVTWDTGRRDRLRHLHC